MKVMGRWGLSLGVLLGLFAFLIFGIQGSTAQDGDGTGRYKTVEIRAIQYIWEMINNADGTVICQVITDHEGLPTEDEALATCQAEIFYPEQTVTPTGEPEEVTPTPAVTLTPQATETPFERGVFFKSISWRFVTSREFFRTIKVPLPDMVVHIRVPAVQMDTPYAIISAFEPVVGYRITAIRGALNGWEFVCSSDHCQVPISGDSVLDFWAESSFGDESRHYQATLREIVTAQGIKIEISSVDAISTFTDSCALSWGSNLYQAPNWSQFPPSPEDLHTKKQYQYLAGQLIYRGIVDASGCPGGGLYSATAPNPCGMERAEKTVIEWQNQYDVAIWDSARKFGIPPRLIKTLIEQESQFWPGNSRIAFYEYGLGQLSQTGADVVLRWDNDLFAEICNGLLYNCGLVYGRLPGWLQATLRGGLLKALNAECSTCTNGIDLARAHESIPVFTRTLRANCYQVNHIMNGYKKKASYEDMWRFTLVSYHSGYQCLNDALYYADYNDTPIDWENVSLFLNCAGSKTYVDTFWKSLTEYETSRLIPTESSRPVTVPTFLPTPVATRTPSPTRTPTPVLSMSHVRVLVYVDSNGNNIPESSERVDDLPVEIAFDDGTVLSEATQNGEVDFDMTGRPVGMSATVRLPGLYYTQRIRVMKDGEIPVIFRLEQPVIPPVLP